MLESQIHAVVDNGSGYMKAGFSGESSPRYIYPTIVGRTKVEGVYVGTEKKESIVGEEADQKYGILNMVHPIQEGLITSWDNMEKIWNHTFYSMLKIPPEETNVLLTEAPYNPRRNREQTIKMMFETFNVPGVSLCSQSVLSLYAVGKHTAIAVDCGEGSTNIAPVYEGFLCKDTVTHNPIAGKAIHDSLIRLIEKGGQTLQSKMMKEHMRKVKEEFCYICPDFEAENTNYETENISTQYQLPDQNEITLGKEKFEAPEVLFNPKMFGYECLSIQDQFMESVKKIDMDIRKDMMSNIIFNGGTTLFKGFKPRVDKEIKQVAKSMECKIKVHCYPEAQYAAWIGGSILSSMSNFETIWVTRADYKEHGDSAVHKLCF